MCQSIFVNRSLKLKFTVKIRKNRSHKSLKLDVTILNSENEKCSLCLCNLLLQIKEEFVIQVLSEFLITNNIITLNAINVSAYMFVRKKEYLYVVMGQLN